MPRSDGSAITGEVSFSVSSAPRYLRTPADAAELPGGIPLPPVLAVDGQTISGWTGYPDESVGPGGRGDRTGTRALLGPPADGWARQGQAGHRQGPLTMERASEAAPSG